MRCVLIALLIAATATADESPAKPVELRETPPPPRQEDPKPLASREAADALTEQELQQVIDLLRENYIRPDATTEPALSRARVQGVLDRLGAGARIYSQVAKSPAGASPFRSERLPGGAGYLRMGSLENIGALDAALDAFAAKPPGSMVLDFRATPHCTDFEFAAEVCRRFAPKGRILFSVKRPKANDEEILTSREEPRWRGLLVILVDANTAGAAEVVAAVLRTHLRAYVIGQRTKGEAAQFEDVPLPGGKVLRIATGEVTLPDNSRVFPGGLTPDLTLAVPQEKTDAVLLAAVEGGVAPLIVEKERARMNEAALVAGENPELDAAHARQKAAATGANAAEQLRDEAVQRALDYITTVGVYEAAKAKR